MEAFVDTEKQNESEQTWLLEQLRNYKQQYEQLSGATRRSVLFKKNELEQSARADLLKGSSDNSVSSGAMAARSLSRVLLGLKGRKSARKSRL